MSFPYRRQLLLSTIGSVLISSGILGGLAFVTIQLARALKIEEPNGPVVVKTEESEDTEEVEEVQEVYEPSPTVTAPPVSTVPVKEERLDSPEAVPVPEVQETPKMDDLAWSEEEFEPWEEEKKPEPKVEPKVTRKPAPPRNSSPSKPAGKPTSARVVSRSTPTYPSRARRDGIEGKVTVLVTISTVGRVSNARVTSSSGNASLDAAALKAALHYRFTPAKNSLGQTVSSQAAIPFKFRLN